MAKPQVYPATFQEDAGWTALARVQNPDGDNITQASVDAIAYVVKDEDGTTGSGNLTVSSVVFDTLQGTTANPDARWDGDETGFNFAFEVPASAFPSGAKWYRVEFTFTPDSGEAYKLVYEGATVSSVGD